MFEASIASYHRYASVFSVLIGIYLLYKTVFLNKCHVLFFIVLVR